LEIFTQHHCALNRGCGGWVSSFIIGFCGYASGEAIFPSVCVNPDSPVASTAFVANSRFVTATLPVGRQL